MRNKIIVLVIVFIASAVSYELLAQCSMCAATIETSGNEGGTIGRGLNNGILYLMVFPYILMGIVAFAFYRKYKQFKKQ